MNGLSKIETSGLPMDMHQHAIDARIKAPIHGSSPKSSGHVHGESGSFDLSKIETSGLPMDMSGGLRTAPVYGSFDTGIDGMLKGVQIRIPYSPYLSQLRN
jgi:hypothetical protein